MKAPSLALLTLAMQSVPPLGIWLIATGCYGEPRRIPFAGEEAVSLAWLALSVALCWLLAGRAAYRLFSECGSGVALSLCAICCLPAWLCGALYLQSLLVFAGLI